jgi:hypothetical protein
MSTSRQFLGVAAQTVRLRQMDGGFLRDIILAASG